MSSAPVPPTPLRELTTLRLGGPPARLVSAPDANAVIAAVRGADTDGEPLLVLAGGSNVVVADAGFPGTVVRVTSRGVRRQERADGVVELEVAAGEPWDALVDACVADGLAGVECLAGIPGSVGATPIQNVGAYGQEVSEAIAAVTVLDRRSGAVATMTARECAFGYRTSIFKRTPGRWVVLAVTFALRRAERSAPVGYDELARALGVELGGRAGLAEVHEAVLALRRAKGMVLDDGDPDTASAGSFFTNPVLGADAFAALQRRVAERLGIDARAPAFAQADGSVKTSAAWLIERAGFARGHGDPRTIAISSKHTLALTNRGAGTTTQLLALAHEIAAGVRTTFGVELVPEPMLVGHQWA